MNNEQTAKSESLNRCAIGLKLASTFSTAPVKKRYLDLFLSAIRLGRTAVIAIRKRDIPLQIPGMIIDMYVARLMLLRPNEKERYGLRFSRKYKWLLAVATLYAPTCGRRW